MSSLRHPDRFANWLNGIVRNIYLSWRRERKENHSIEQMEESRLVSGNPGPEETLEARTLRSSVMKAIDSLSEKNRVAVTLYYIDGLGYEEIADFLDISTNTLKGRLRRSREALKEKMLCIVEEEFSRHRLTNNFRREISKAIDELKSITILTLKTEWKAEERPINVRSVFNTAVEECGGEMYEYEEGYLSAIFGVRTFHEDVSERAILSTLEIRDRLAEHNGSLKFRTAVVTGMAEVRAGKYEPMGDILKSASHIVDAACDGMILACQTSYRLAKGRFLFSEFRKDDVHAYEVVNRLEHPRRLWEIDGLASPMIGRNREFAKLMGHVDRLLEGESRIVSIIGEAGIGKSIMASELRSYAKEKEILWLEGRCISYGQHKSYTPFLEVIREYFGINVNDSYNDKYSAKIVS